MALIQCADCGLDLSQAATRCPHCGAPNHRRRADRIRRLAMVPVVGVAVVIGCLVFYVASYPTRAERELRELSQSQADAEWSRLRQVAIDVKAQEDATAAASTSTLAR